MGSPYKGRDMVAPLQWGVHTSDLLHLSKASAACWPRLCCGGAALAQAGQTPSLPHVQKQARVPGLFLRLGSPVTNPRARQTHLMLKLSLSSSRRGRQRPQRPPPLQGDKRAAQPLLAPRLRSAPAEGRAEQASPALPGSPRALPGPGRGGRSGVRAGTAPQRWGGAATAL